MHGVRCAAPTRGSLLLPEGFKRLAPASSAQSSRGLTLPRSQACTVQLFRAAGTPDSDRHGNSPGVSRWTGCPAPVAQEHPRQMDGQMAPLPDALARSSGPLPHCPGFLLIRADHGIWPRSLGTLTFKGRSRRARAGPGAQTSPRRPRSPGLHTGLAAGPQIS